jgi:hypothetical protein
VDRFIARENIKHFRDRLWSENDRDTWSRIQKLLVAEEDKLGADLELLADIERHIADGSQRIERQQALVAIMQRDGHDGLPVAQALLDGMIEGQILHVAYRERTLTAIKQNRL